MRQSTARKKEETNHTQNIAHTHVAKSTVVSLPAYSVSSSKNAKIKAPMTNQDYIAKMEVGRFEAICEKLGDFA